MTTSAQSPGSPAGRVEVALSGSGTEDARAVFGALHTAYASDRSPDDVPRVPDSGRPTVWSATFHTDDPHASPSPVRLSGPVTATVQGGYQACDALCETLASAFAVKVVGTASGDQEKEMQLSLANR